MSVTRPVTARRRGASSAGAVPEGRLRLRGVAVAFALGAAVTGGAWVAIATLPREAANASAGAKAEAVPCRTLADVVAVGPGELAEMDIAEMNLLCAAGLPGADGLDFGRCLARLDEWAEHVRRETDRHLYRFRREPGEYDHSEGYFRMLMLVTVLQQDLGVHYNAKRLRDVDFRRSEDLFLHGLLIHRRTP